MFCLRMQYNVSGDAQTSRALSANFFYMYINYCNCDSFVIAYNYHYSTLLDLVIYIIIKNKIEIYGIVFLRLFISCILVTSANKYNVPYIIEPVHAISNNVVCATSKAPDQPAHTRSLVRAFASRLNIL